MSLKIKICGLKYPENIRAVAGAHPDFLGFIFYPQSPRYVGPDFAMPHDLPAQTARVGVFVNQDTEEIEHLANRYRLTYIQLHGHERPEVCLHLRKRGHMVIKAFGLHDEFDFGQLERYIPVTDYFLFDTQSAQFGGSGKVFNWSLLNQYTCDKPFFLSGGLSPQVLARQPLPRHPRLFALDVNSGVEDKPGLKITEAVREVMHIIQNQQS